MIKLRNLRSYMSNMLLFMPFLIIIIYLAGCAGAQKETKPDTPQAPAADKRGRLKGPQYYNEYFKFQITTPRGWRASRPKSEFLVRMAALRDNVKIEIAVSEYSDTPNLEAEALHIFKDKALEIVSQSSETFCDQPAISYELTKIDGTSTKRITAVFIQKNNFIFQIYSTGPVDSFEKNEHSLKEAMDSFLFTEKFVEGFGQEDYFNYLVKPGDSLHKLANRFFNDPNQDKSIAYFNQISALAPYRPIDIPRYVTYVVNEEDTPEKLSQQFYNSPDRFNLIPPYNPTVDESSLLQPGSKIKIPMYFNYTIKEGDTLPQIAKQYLRSENQAELIHIYNGGKTIRTGSIIKIPILWKLRDFILYVVKPKDSLGSIAIKFTGNKNNYLPIAEFNNIPPPFALSIGQKLKIPKDMIKIRKPPKKPAKKEEEEIEGPIYDVDDIEGPIYEPD